MYRPKPVTSKLPADWADAIVVMLTSSAREIPRTRIPLSGFKTWGKMNAGSARYLSGLRITPVSDSRGKIMTDGVRTGEVMESARHGVAHRWAIAL